MNFPGVRSHRLSLGLHQHGTLLVLLACSTAGCDLPGRPRPEDQYVPPQQERTFSVLFQKNCVGCHGADGKLGPAPPLNDPLFLALIPDAELQHVVSEGRPGTLMPAFAVANGGPLTAEQVKILAEGIKSTWGPVESPPRGTVPPLFEQLEPEATPVSASPPEVIRVPPHPRTPTDSEAKPIAPAVPEVLHVLPRSWPQATSNEAGAGNKHEGFNVFARACAPCHGDHGQGITRDDRRIRTINDPDFLALVSDQALRRYVITGRPDLGMPNYADPKGRPKDFKPLTSQEVTDLVALLASWREGGSVKGTRN